MAFCTSCGKQLSGKYCTDCGQANEATVLVMERPQAEDISIMDRQALMKTIAEAERVLTAYENCRDTAEVIVEDVREKREVIVDPRAILLSKEEKKEKARREKQLAKQHPKEYKMVMIAAYSAIASVPLAVLLCSVVQSLLPVLIAVIAFIFMFYSMNQWEGIRRKYSEEKDVAPVRDIWDRKIDAALTVCERSVALNSIPPAYRYTYAMEHMAQLVQNFRANTWIECADKYEEMMHRMQVEGLLQRNNELLEINNFYQQQIARNTRAAAIFTGLNFFFN